VLDRAGRDRTRLLGLLELADEHLIAAIGGSRAARLGREYEAFDARRLVLPTEIESVCVHDDAFPAPLRGRAVPRALFATGGLGRLARLTGGPVVAVAACRGASDYGIETATSLARGLAASGIAVTSVLGEGTGRAALQGAAASRRAIAIAGDGHSALAPARTLSLGRAVACRGTVVSELPCGIGGRGWGGGAAARTSVELAALTVVVEAEDRPGDRIWSAVAGSCGRPLAAVPGRVTSPLATGPNALLRGGSALVRDAADVLELLAGLAPRTPGAPRRPLPRRAASTLSGEQRRVLRAVAGGRDTAARLCEDAEDPYEVLRILSELELIGVVGRGEAGRYVPRIPPPPS
jgi:DNA processing protein